MNKFKALVRETADEVKDIALMLALAGVFVSYIASFLLAAYIPFVLVRALFN